MTTIPMKDVYITGSNITLSCSAESDPPATIQWAFDGMDLTHSGSQLQLKKVTLNHTGSYKCVFYNNVTSRFSYASEMIRIMASSNPPSHYRWFFNGSPAANTSEYVIGPLTLNMSGMYTCMASNNITRRDSTAYKMLTVFAPVNMATVEMAGAPPIQNHTFTLICETAGSVESRYWMKDGWPLHADSRRVLSIDNTTLTFDPVLRSDNGRYQCEASNALSNLTNPIKDVEIETPLTPAIEVGPGETSISGPSLAETGDYALFNCSAPSWPPSHFSWWFNDSLVANISMFKAGPLYLNMSGYYTCVAYNDVTEKNSKNSTMLTVIEAIQSVMVKSNTIPIASKNLTLSCEVIGPYNSIYWKKDNMRLAMNSSTMNSSMSYYTGSNSLHFNPVTVYDDGIYQCVATNSVRLHTSPDYKLLVNYGPLSVVINGPFSVQLGSVLTVSLSCSADSRPTSEYQWLFNDQPSVVGTSSVLTIWAKKENMGNYTCKATNPVTNITMSQTEAFIVSHASALPLQSRGGLILMALFALLLPVVNDLLTH
ncbi:carcinoembryonic antigen-related cell adhesion molecule 1 [Diretmus argenteus]